ncbi:MAG: tetratricopeptide repeat protein [Bacteroidia bacterium]
MESNENKLSANELIDRGVDRAVQTDWAGAREDFESAIRRDPRSFEAFSNLGSVFQAQGEHKAAVDAYHRALEIAPDHIASRYCLGISLAALGEWENALSTYDQVIAMHETYWRAYMGRGFVRASMGRYLEALTDFGLFLENGEETELKQQVEEWTTEVKRLLLSAPEESYQWGADQIEYADALIVRAIFFKEQGDYVPAVRDLVSASEMTPENPAIFDLLDEILNMYDTQVAEKPGDPYVYVNRAGIMGLVGRPQEAISDWSQAILLAPSDALLYNGRGKLYLAADDPVRAWEDLTRAIELDPRHAQFYYDRAEVNTILVKPEEAWKDITHAIKMAPEKAEFYLYRASLQRIRGQYEAAVEDFTEVIGREYELADAFHGRAFCHIATGNIEAAAEDYMAAAKAGPRSDILFDCATTLLYLGKAEQALSFLDELIHYEPGFAEAWAERGKAQMWMGQNAAALSDLSEAIRLDPRMYEPWLYRAELYLSERNWAGAVADAGRAIFRNENEAEPYRIRGLALFYLGEYPACSKDLRMYLKNNESPDEAERTHIEQIAGEAEKKGRKTGWAWKPKG